MLRPIIAYSGTTEGSGGTQVPPPIPIPTPAAAGSEGGGGRSQDTIAQLRAEAAAERIGRRDAHVRVEQLQADMERLKAEQQAAITAALQPEIAKRTKAQNRAVQSELRAVATQAGLRDPDLLVMIDKAPGAPKVEINDDGEIVNAEAAVEAFKKWKPDFFASSAAGAGGSGAGGGSGESRDTGGGSGAGQGQGGGGSGSQTQGGGTRSTGAAGAPSPATGTARVNVKGMTTDEYKAFRQKTLAEMRQPR